MRRRGMSLIELVVATAAAAVLLAAVVGLMSLGRAAFREALEDQDLLRTAYFGPAELGAAAYSTPQSLQSEVDALAFWTAYDEAGHFHTDEQGRPVWQAYQVYRVDDGRLTAYRAPLDGSPFEPRPGRTVAEGIAGLEAELTEARWLLRLELEGGGVRQMTVEVLN